MTQQTPDLPDTSKWQPRDTVSETLSSAFLKRCVAVEESISQRVQAEREMTLDNFDSGLAQLPQFGAGRGLIHVQEG